MPTPKQSKIRVSLLTPPKLKLSLGIWERLVPGLPRTLKATDALYKMTRISAYGWPSTPTDFQPQVKKSPIFTEKIPVSKWTRTDQTAVSPTRTHVRVSLCVCSGITLRLLCLHLWFWVCWSSP